ncbi:hypothetical protein ANO14919_022990 [Xylariales sp. No.14919]|nr:hypothetical protein ANO14919_022990 [Xylariales sp. No.14919]
MTNSRSNDTRRQPWKLYCDPVSPDFRSAIQNAPEQRLSAAGDKSLVVYGGENGQRLTTAGASLRAYQGENP